MSASTRLAGHELLWEGAPHEKRANGTFSRRWGQGTGGTGHGLCSCGASSGEMTSGTQRKKWHREHKQQIREAQA
ncbi:hypothetical protein RDI86_02195 [Cellulosimicrobium sp. XJ-DQ-B-000]|uniref:hypothetical protein n=1 Tax=Cellulosimicrobium sp. XJ-DQ-B-000 TaxID=3072182 RepID=UPI0028082C31|nr:hypothetical protein [Cellulosimicrobium sp. XJ-DQ-B-000]MDQ8040652.1 hypothetical protein [Cellulosimicrobium sp. XJ-DQ-B-000]